MVILSIIDGWGYSEKTSNNAWFSAKTPTFDFLFQHFPSYLLKTSGNSVGLPEGQMGNSEVGHMTIGAGRIIRQDLDIINESIQDGSFYNNQVFHRGINNRNLKQNNSPTAQYHIMGLFSDGGVHSHINHILATIKSILLIHSKAKIVIHAITDGRDSGVKSFMKYLKYFKQEVALIQKELQNDEAEIIIATIIGRYYAMDRDNRNERTTLAFNNIFYGNDVKNNSSALIYKEENQELVNFIHSQYNDGITDEFIKSGAHINYFGIQDNDIFITTNFRADRIRQIMRMLLDKNPKVEFINMTNYSSEIDEKSKILFSNKVVKNTLSEIISKNNKKQLKIAETEKYPHVTFFLNGGVEEPFLNEDRILIPSPKVSTYDLQPEMSAFEITDVLIDAIKSKKYDFICINFANADMVGHTGNFKASVKACEVLDQCFQKIISYLGGEDKLFITSDHGNIEEMYIDEAQEIHTTHTLNPVPFIIYSKVYDFKKNQHSNMSLAGSLKDIAPTILDSMAINIPHEMSGAVIEKAL